MLPGEVEKRRKAIQDILNKEPSPMRQKINEQEELDYFADPQHEVTYDSVPEEAKEFINIEVDKPLQTPLQLKDFPELDEDEFNLETEMTDEGLQIKNLASMRAEFKTKQAIS